MDPGTSSGSKVTRLIGFPHVRFSVRSQCPLMAQSGRPRANSLGGDPDQALASAVAKSRGASHGLISRKGSDAICASS